MTRKRVCYDGALYHVTNKGNRGEKIFKDRLDYLSYLDIIEEALDFYKDFRYKLVCYCLMGNHVHLILKIDKEPLGKLMGRINSRYTYYFNRKYSYKGHLFQGRYYSKAIGDDGQLLENSRYIHLNPVRAKIVKKVEEYEWSSYKVYIGNSKDDLVDCDVILDKFNPKNKHKTYKEFIRVIS